MKEFQSGAQGALGIVFVRRRIPKIHHHAIALELRDEAAEPFHYRQGKVLVAALQEPKVFRIEPLGKRRVSNQIDENAG
jgi:hypothetical protein